MTGSSAVTRWSGVALGVSFGWIAAYQYFKLPPVLPVLLERYDYDPLLAGMLMSVFALAGLLLSSWVGRHMDGPHRVRLILAACTLSLCGSVLGAWVPQAPLAMLLARALEGLSYAILSVIGVVVTVQSARARHRPLAIGLWATWIPAGQIIAAALAVPLLGAGYWQALWYVGALASAVVLWLALRHNRLGRSSESTDSPADFAADGVSARAAATERWSRVWPAALFALWSGQYIAFVTWLPQYLVETRGLAADRAALAYLLVPGLVIVFNLAAGALMHRRASIGWLLVPSLIAQGLLWLLMPKVTSTAMGVTLLAAYGVASGIIPTCLFSLPGALHDTPRAQARAFGVLMAGRNLGALIGPILLPHIRSLVVSWGAVAWAFGSATLAGALLALAITRRIARRVEP